MNTAVDQPQGLHEFESKKILRVVFTIVFEGAVNNIRDRFEAGLYTFNSRISKQPGQLHHHMLCLQPLLVCFDHTVRVFGKWSVYANAKTDDGAVFFISELGKLFEQHLFKKPVEAIH